jgi:hypothetical protein
MFFSFGCHGNQSSARKKFFEQFLKVTTKRTFL